MTTTAAIDRVLEPINKCLTPAVARKIAGLRADADLASRLEELGAKANDCRLTQRERAEYESYVRGIDLNSILQSQARRFLNDAQKNAASM